MEQIVELPSGKCIRKYSPEHPLFAAGTLQWAAKYYQDAESMVQPEEVDAKVDEASTITCRLANCNVEFQTITGYEEHYDMVHRNICRECSRSFLSLRLLDIHISETHDAFFKILSKKQPMYVCLVDGCPETFQHDDKRTRHLMQVHQYPESFSFHPKRKHPKNSKASKGNSNTKPDNQGEVDAATLKKREARKRRRQKKKENMSKNQSRDAEMQVDGQAVTGDSHEAGSKVADVEMDDLEKNMRELRIPKSIQFGRKRRV